MSLPTLVSGLIFGLFFPPTPPQPLDFSLRMTENSNDHYWHLVIKLKGSIVGGEVRDVMVVREMAGQT